MFKNNTYNSIGYIVSNRNKEKNTIILFLIIMIFVLKQFFVEMNIFALVVSYYLIY